MESYLEKGVCLHPELFYGHWLERWVDPALKTACEMIDKGSTLRELIDAGLLREEFPGVYSVAAFSRELCEMVVAETENVIKYCTDNNIVVHRPNSMNRYGLVLNMIGMKESLSDLQQLYLLPLSRLTFPVEGSAFSDHHTFIVSYDTKRDRSLDMHTDDSDVTWNICLGKEGFTGSGLTFCGRMAESDHRQLQGQYSHALGRAVCHLGHQRHGADTITGGERHNLIMWCKNAEYRASELFEQKMRHYEKESGPPSLQCLSYTHDRDYIAFKQYPKGKNPYQLDSESEEDSDSGGIDDADGTSERRAQSLPWCPPTRFQYDGMFSQNKLMLIHFQNEVDREEEQKKKRHKKTSDSNDEA